MSYPYPAPYPPPYQPLPRPPSTSTTGPKVLTFIGIALLVLLTGLGVGGGALFVSGLSSIAEINSEVDTEAITTVLPGQTATVDLSADTKYTLWRGTVADQGISGSEPAVTDPRGRSVTVTTATYTSSSRDEVFESWRFTTQEAGTHQISAAADGPALQLLPDNVVERLVDGAIGVVQVSGGFGMVLAAIVVAPIGLGLLIGGAVWWSVRSKNARRAAPTDQPEF
ncbi:MAG: hypothetical protein FWH11_14545 [Micrococcales bacterium]|nr:hypothetical protein [Micrococcales bacterium]